MDKLKSADFVPDIILADYRLRRNETGSEVIKSIQTKFDKAIPAIIVTGDTAPDRINEARSSGYSLIHKPVSVDKLQAILNYILHKEHNRVTPSS